MNKRTSYFLLMLFAMLSFSVAQAAVSSTVTRVVGGDLSLVPAYEAAGDKWLDADGKVINAEYDDGMITYLRDVAGWTAVRCRLLVDPSQDSYVATQQDLTYVKKLGKRVKDAGMYFLLDIFYSDTWTDVSQQWIPTSWGYNKNTATATLAAKVKSYTTEVLNALAAYGAQPDYVQIGNEVSYGMLWDNLSGKSTSNAFYTSGTYSQYSTQINCFATLLKAAAEGVRAATNGTKMKIVLHSERTANSTHTKNFYTWVEQAGFTDYDIIGLSYYPTWHGTISMLESTLSTLQTSWPNKEIQIVETGYYFSKPSSPTYDTSSTWAYSTSGQASFLGTLTSTLNGYTNVTGLYYWQPEECGNGANSSGTNQVMDAWDNRGFWACSWKSGSHTLNSETALMTLKNFNHTALGEEDDDDTGITVYVNTLLSDGTTSSGSCYINIWDSGWNKLVGSTNPGVQLSTLPTKTVGGTTYYYVKVEPTTTSIYVILNNGSWGKGTNQTDDLSYSEDVYLTYDGATFVTSSVITYTIASDKALTGAFWDETNTSCDMTKSGDNYTLTLTDRPIFAGWYYYKVVTNHSWENAYPSENAYVQCKEDGYYTVTFTYNPSTPKLTCDLNKTGTLTITGYDVLGAEDVFGSDWDFTNNMTLQADGTYTATVTTSALTADKEYSYKASANDTWGIKEFPESGNQTITVPVDGTYQITFTLDPSKSDTEGLTITKKALMLSVGSTGANYSTAYYSKAPLTVPEGVSGYTYRFNSSGKLEVSHTYVSGDVIPAGQPVVLYASSAEAYPFDVLSTSGTADSSCHLVGTDTETTTSVAGAAKYYQLSLDKDNTAGTLGWYWGAANGGAFTCAAHKVYLYLPTSLASMVSAQSFLLDGETTGINAVDEWTGKQVNESDIYTLDGRKVKNSSEFQVHSSQLPKGIYVKNGKKFVVK